MKNFTLILILMISSLGFSQETDSLSFEAIGNQGNNMLSINALALSVGSISLQYERLISPKISFGLMLNHRPDNKLPFLGMAENWVDDEDTMKHLETSSISSFSVTPEVRFYFGKEGFRGFYIAPFARFGSYKMEFSLDYIYVQNESFNEDQIIVDGEIDSFSGGIGFGAKWKLSNSLYLDWMIMGPHYGSAKGTLVGNKSLTQQEQDAIIYELENFDIPIIEYDYEVNSNGAKVNMDGPWGGVRAIIGLGFRF